MEPAIVVVAAFIYGASAYLMLSRSVIRIVLGVAILSNAVHLTIFSAGRITREVPPLVPPPLDVPEGVFANPLPQALILTAIVISFSLLAFVLVLTYRAYQSLGTDNTDTMRVAAPDEHRPPPAGY